MYYLKKIPKIYINKIDEFTVHAQFTFSIYEIYNKCNTRLI